MFNRKTGKMDVVLGENSRISGDVFSSGTILVEGAVVGDLDGEKVILGEKSVVQGNIRAVVISVAGRVEGNLSGKEAVEIKAKARIFGNIRTRTLSIMEGAVFNGTCDMEDGEGDAGNEKNRKIVEFSSR